MHLTYKGKTRPWNELNRISQVVELEDTFDTHTISDDNSKSTGRRITTSVCGCESL